MKNTIKYCTALAAVMAVSGFSAAAHATDFLSQIVGGTPDGIDGSMIFEPAYDAYSLATIDDFTLTSAATITSVAGYLGGYNGFTDASYAGINYYSVNIYSSLAAAGNSITGDVASFDITPSQASVVFGPDTADGTATVTLPVNFTLAAGTYYVGISPQLNYTDGFGQVGVGVTTGGNAYQTNPGGGFGEGSTFPASDANGNPASAEYNVSGTYNAVSAAPEPASWALMMFGIGGMGFALRQAKKKHGFTFKGALAA